MNTTANIDEVYKVINAEHHDPFSVLGMHRLESENAMVVRAYLPNAKEIEVVELSKNNTYPMEKIDERAFLRL